MSGMKAFRRGPRLPMGDAPPDDGEDFRDIGILHDVRIESILSSNHPDPGTQVQPHDEWVVLLRGTATLELDHDAGTSALTLVAGDTLFIAAGTPHRVLATDHGALWLALHAPPREG
jgi:mannose-6-phosphate isomerase-like protein (cupin superfamily)